MSEQQQTIITRKARLWPEIPRDTIEIPHPPAFPNTIHPIMFISLLCGMIGLSIYAIFFLIFLPRLSEATFFLGGLLTTSAFMLLMSVLSFFFQWLPTHHHKKDLTALYLAKLADIQIQLQAYTRLERQSRCDLDPPLFLPDHLPLSGYEHLSIIPIIHRSLDNQDAQLWTRRQGDPDFLAVRIGMGSLAPSFTLRPEAPPVSLLTPLPALAEQMQTLLTTHSSLLVPITVKLNAQNSTTLLGSQARLLQARQLACQMLAHLAYHHSPEDVRIIVLAPESQRMSWDWSTLLPHTILYDARQALADGLESDSPHAVAIGNEAIIQQLPLISRELGRREGLLGARSPQAHSRPSLPHLVIVVDHFDALEDLDQPTMFLNAAIMPFKKQKKNTLLHRPRLTVSPLLRPELTLALNYGQALNVSVLSICDDPTTIPPTTSLLIDLDGPLGNLLPPQQLATQARLRQLQADAPPAITCQLLDHAPLETLRLLGMRLQLLLPASTRKPELRTQVDIRMLFEPRLDLLTYDPQAYWNDASLRTPAGLPLLRIPIGLKIGDETQYLDFIKDGPHGLLVGQTGSGKSELLQTIISALAIAYRPSEVNFLLVDYNSGLALTPFSQLPHTVAFLSNLSSPTLIQRFITMLRAEATRREQSLKEGLPNPRLIIIIDEFAEMVRRTDSVLEDLFTITRVGREVGMHLLLAAQRPEGAIGRRVRDHVQYRLCLRCSSPEDSREVLRRVDAANLPASIPGRSYLLHGDNQLDLFQAARVNVPALAQAQATRSLLERNAKIIPLFS